MRFPHHAREPIREVRTSRDLLLQVGFFLLCLDVGFLSGCRPQTISNCLAPNAARSELVLGGAIQQDLRGGETQCYQVRLGSEQYLHLTVDQIGIDVVITVFDPTAKQVAHIDRPNGSRGREGVSIIGTQNGNYILQIRSLESAANQAQYRIGVDEIRSVSAMDEKRALAEQTLSDAEDLRASGEPAKLPLAISKFEESVRLWQELKDRYEECVSIYGLALGHRSANDNQEAIAKFEEARLIAHELGDVYMEGVALKDAGWSLIYVGDAGQALTKFSAAKDLLHSINESRAEGIAVYGIVWSYALEGDDAQALAHFRESLEIRRAANDRRGEALTLTGIGKILNRTNRNAEALATLNNALELLKNSKGDARADTLSALAWVYSSLNELENARNYFEQALTIWRTSGDRTGEATTLYGLAKVESQRGDLLDAKEHMRQTLDIVEAMRTKGSNERLRTSYFGLVQDYFDFDIDLLMRLDGLYPGKGYAAAAFEVSERSRNRKLLDLLNEAHGDIRAGIDPLLLNQEKAISQELNTAANAQKALGAQSTAAEIASAAKKVDELTYKLEEIEARIRQVSPQYALLTEARTISFGDVQKQLLDDNTMLLEYALGEQRSYLWAITRKEITSYTLPSRRQIDEMARELYEVLSARESDVPGETIAQRRERIARADAAYPNAALELSRVLMGPVANRLGSKRLIFVTQSALGLIPFAALPLPDSLDGASDEPLLVSHEISNAPSASSLVEFRRRRSRGAPNLKRIAIIADPVFQKDDERFLTATGANENSGVNQASTVLATNGPSSSEPSTENLPRLFSTRWEAYQIADLVPASQRSLALDFAANQDFVTGSELPGYRVIHFATHTLIDDEHPELSRIALSGFDLNGNRIDGYLHAHEIYRLRLPVELVVLSSCRTAKGSEVKGEGLVAIAHAFMCAGAPRVMGALWGVDDTPTSEFMVRYYRKMFGPKHLTPAAALRVTQLEFLRDRRWQFPYFWGSFSLEGEWRGW